MRRLDRPVTRMFTGFVAVVLCAAVAASWGAISATAACRTCEPAPQVADGRAAVALQHARERSSENGTPDPRITDGSAARALAQARHTWHTSGRTSYRFTLRLGCFCAPQTVGPHRVTVRHGRAVTPKPWLVRLKLTTVRGLFGKIADGIANGDHVLDVTYDDATGQPLTVALDPIENVADDEITYTATRARAIPGR